MQSFRCRVEFANELDVKNVPFDCQKRAMILAANSARDVVPTCLPSEAIKATSNTALSSPHGLCLGIRRATRTAPAAPTLRP
jgi:hypothetical protein